MCLNGIDHILLISHSCLTSHWSHQSFLPPSCPYVPETLLLWHPQNMHFLVSESSRSPRAAFQSREWHCFRGCWLWGLELISDRNTVMGDFLWLFFFFLNILGSEFSQHELKNGQTERNLNII